MKKKPKTREELSQYLRNLIRQTSVPDISAFDIVLERKAEISKADLQELEETIAEVSDWVDDLYVKFKPDE